MAEVLADWAADRPDEVALIDEFGETRWSQLNERTNRLIHALRGAGLEAGDTFAVVSGNRREYFEALAAATHAGMLLVPVNWHWHPEEIAYVLRDADAKALIGEARFETALHETLEREDCPELSLRLMVGGEARAPFESYEDALASASAAEPENQSAGGPMFYTSGTTGRPKGVRNNMLAAAPPAGLYKLMGVGFLNSLELTDSPRTLLEGPIYHSAQWAFAFLPLMGGSPVVMRHKFDAQETLELIDRHAITNVHLVPTQFVRMLKLPDDVRSAFSGKSLKLVMHGAAPCPKAVKHQMIEWFGPVVTEYYGATEGGIICQITAEDWLRKDGSLGKPADNIEVIVIGESGDRLPVGEAGQLYFRNSTGGGFEYHKDPEKTKSAHLEPGVFTFGDVGFLDDEGYLHMSDRKIDMVISGGVNIYPAEIEGVLVTHPAVQDAAVFGIPNEEFGEEVKAAVELMPGQTPSDDLASELIAHCRDHLAGYKAPRSVDFEAALPRHPTGKLYKRLLRDPYWEGQERSI